MPPSEPPLLTPAFLRRLERLRLLLRRGAGGSPAGGRTSRQRGGVTEFAQHREYVPGDDPRTIDWAAYARSGKPVVKEFAREEIARLRIVLDTSASMAAEDPTKWRRAREVAAAAAALALFGHAHAEVFTSADGALRPLAAAETEAGLGAVLRALESLAAGGASSPVAALRSARGGPWATCLVSDLLDPADPRPALAGSARGGDLIVVHLLAPTEAHPDLDGPAVLADAESGATLAVEADDTLRAAYAAALAGHRERWRSAVVAAAGRYVFATSDEPVEAIVHRWLRPAAAAARPA